MTITTELWFAYSLKLSEGHVILVSESINSYRTFLSMCVSGWVPSGEESLMSRFSFIWLRNASRGIK